MRNIERRFEQEQTFRRLLVLDRYIFGEHILFVQVIAQCYLKEKRLKNDPF